MKVDGITLLQMIRDWKIEEGTKIKIINEFSDYRNNEKLVVYPDRLEYENGETVSTDLILCKFNMFEIEIIEDIEKGGRMIEKIRQFCEYPCSDRYECWSIKEDILVNKINEIIDEVNKLKKEGN